MSFLMSHRRDARPSLPNTCPAMTRVNTLAQKLIVCTRVAAMSGTEMTQLDYNEEGLDGFTSKNEVVRSPESVAPPMTEGFIFYDKPRL